MEYDIEYKILFQCHNKNLEKISEIRALGSSITSMEMCMIFEDRLKELKLKDEKVKKLSYNFNRDDYIELIIHITSDKKLSKDYLLELKERFLKVINEEFKVNRIHVFKGNEVYLQLR